MPSRIAPAGPHHRQRDLTAAQRKVFRDLSARSRAARYAALRGEGPDPLHEINVPNLRPEQLMPQRPDTGLSALSLFSGGGGLDLGFDRAGFRHIASWELLEDAAATLTKARPDWEVHGGTDGDVTRADWKRWRDQVDVVHGGPPCQPFSHAGRQQGRKDVRDMWPAFVECLTATRPAAFVAENVPALASAKFTDYVRDHILRPLEGRYRIQMITLRAEDFGVPQVRRRVMFVGFARVRDAKRFQAPQPTHLWTPDLWSSAEPAPERARCLGAREALGLPDIGYDALAPTIRSSLTGPHHTTSVLSSGAAQRAYAKLEIWPNGVSATREQARAFVAENGHFRMAVPDVAVLQGFPEEWPFVGATYMQLGQIGNAVPPPLAYAVASSVVQALS